MPPPPQPIDGRLRRHFFRFVSGKKTRSPTIFPFLFVRSARHCWRLMLLLLPCVHVYLPTYLLIGGVVTSPATYFIPSRGLSRDRLGHDGTGSRSTVFDPALFINPYGTRDDDRTGVGNWRKVKLTGSSTYLTSILLKANMITHFFSLDFAYLLF